MADLKEHQILFEGAQRIMAEKGFTFAAPWQASLDDREKEGYEALRDVIAFVRAEVLAQSKF